MDYAKGNVECSKKAYEIEAECITNMLNYLDEKELRAMGQLVSGYLDFAERLSNAVKMKKLGIDIAVICQVTGLSEQEIANL